MSRKMRLIIVLTGLLLLTTAIMVGQRLFFTGPRVKEPFSLKGQLDARQQDAYLSCDTYRMITSASPFYAGSFPTLGQQTGEFQAVRARKVQQIRDAAARIATRAISLRPKMERLRQSYFTAASAVDARDARLKKVCRLSSRELVASCLRREVALAAYQSIEIPTDDRYAEAAQQYRQTLQAANLGLITLHDAELLLSASLDLTAVCREAKDAKITQAIATLDREMSAYKAVARDLNTLWDDIQQVHAGLHQLYTGDYYFSRSALAFMTQTLPEVKTQAKQLKPTKTLTKADIALTRQYVTLFEQATDTLRRALDAVPTASLATVPSADDYHGAAWGFKDGGNYEKGYKTLAQGLRKEKMSDALPASWEVAKKLPGAMIGIADLGSYSTIRILTGIANKNTYKEITTDIMKESKRLDDAIANGIAGASTLKTAKGYMQGLETSARDAVTDYLQKRMAPMTATETKWGAWLMGNAAKATVSLFTGFAKGVYAIADPSSTKGELAEGALEIGFTFMGGSKVFFPPAAKAGAAKGVAEASALSAKRLLNSLKATVLAEGNVAEVKASKALFTAIAESNAVIDKRLLTLAKDGAITWAGASAGALKGSLAEMVATNFKLSVMGIAKAIVTVVGKSPGAFVENWLGQNADDVIKEFTRALLDAAPAISLSGKWSGSTTIGKATVSNLPGHPSAADLQRVHAALAAMSGKTTAITVNLRSANSGTLSGGGASMPVTLSVNADRVKMTAHQGPATTTYSGTLTQTGSTATISGTFSAKSTEVGIMTITGTFKVSRPL